MTLHNFFIGATAALALLATTSCSKNQPTDRENDNMKGKVKMVTERHFMAIDEFGKVRNGDPYSPVEDEYDSRWTYNENGYRTSYTKLQVGEEDTIWTTSMVYDSINPKLKVLEITDGIDGYVCRYQVTHYNKDNKPDTISTTDGAERLQEQIVVKYASNVEEYSYYDGEGKLRLREENIYDGDDPIEMDSYDGEGKLQRKIVNFWKKGLRDSTIFYDGKGNPMVQLGFSFDDKGNVTDQHGLDENGEALRNETWEYEYDKQGNWTRRIYRLDGKAYYIVERQIEYYK